MKNQKRILAAAAAALIMALVSGCGAKSAQSGKEAEKQEKGSVSMAGSTSMEKLASALQEAFMEKYPQISVSAEFTGSSAGIEALQNQQVDIGNASRALSEEEKSKDIVENIVAIDGIAVITDKNNQVSDLTREDLKKIYLGEITNWSQLGGKDEAIVTIGREAGSGTRDAFEELMEGKNKFQYANELDSTGAVMAKVTSTPGAIGYVSLDVVNDTVSTLSLDGAMPTEESILDQSYPLQRPFVMATRGEISKQSDSVQTFFEFLNSKEGQEIVKQTGLIPVK